MYLLEDISSEVSLAASVGWGEIKKAESNTKQEVNSALLEIFKSGFSFSKGDIPL